MSKRAFFVIGPENSGTRMMTRAFIECGAYGSGGHVQALDKESNEKNQPSGAGFSCLAEDLTGRGRRP